MSDQLKERDNPGSDESGGLPKLDLAGLKQKRDQGADLLAAGSDAIARALSSDSEAFLRATKQSGGQ